MKIIKIIPVIKEKKDIKMNKFKILFYFSFLTNILVISFFIKIYYSIKNKYNIQIQQLTKINSNLNADINEINKFLKNVQQENMDNSLRQQNYFCKNKKLFYKKEFEDRIKSVEINFENKTYNMYIYKCLDYISNAIMKDKNWENNQTKLMLEALNYYSNKTNISNKDIYIIDIGANIGWYSITLGKYGYNLISFEPSNINNYILNKNYCLNKEINITIINKGLYNKEEKCDLYNEIANLGNGMAICDKNSSLPKILIPNKTGEITLTRLRNYIPFLSDKNLVLIKIDVEGSEGKAIEGGIELITKYHVPFIFLEFTPKSLEVHGTDPIKFLHLFIDNGYRISYISFFDNTTNSIKKVMNRNRGILNLYFSYSKIFE